MASFENCNYYSKENRKSMYDENAIEYRICERCKEWDCKWNMNKDKPQSDEFGNQRDFYENRCEKCGYAYFKHPWEVQPKYPIKSDRTKRTMICGKCGHKNVDIIEKC